MELLARIHAHAARDPHRVAYFEAASRRSITFSSLVASIAEGASRPGNGGGRAVTLRARNTIETVISFLASVSSGRDMLLLVDRAPDSRTDPLSPSAPTAERSEASSGHGRDRTAAGVCSDLLLPTSGSTGAPRIVRRSAASLDAVAANVVESVGITAADRVLATVPLGHSYGIEHGLLAPLWAGATTLLCDGLDLPAIARAIDAGVTIFPAVPSILERLADASEPFDRLCDVRAVYSAGAPLPDAVRDRYVARFGTLVGQLYGSTEIGTVTYRHGDEHEGVGLPMRGVSIRVLDGGEVAIRSPSMFGGYLDAPAALVDGHWVTGDLGHLAADGSLVLTGRSKLLIDTGGGKVNPLEVEGVLRGHAGVADVVVVPLRQSETVCRLHAMVVPRDAASPPSVEALRRFARDRLAPHKVPRVFTLRDALPRSATGKVLRPMLDAE